MPRKLDDAATPAQKVLGLFGILVFSGNKYSLPRLAGILKCSKQSVLRMIEQIEKSHEVGIESWMEDGKRWFRVKPLRTRPNVSLTPERIQHLVLCRDMVWHLLPENLRRDVESTIAQSTVLLPDMEQRSEALVSITRARVKGAIDYTPHQEAIEALFLAIRDRRVCQVLYQASNRPEPRVHNFAPVKLLSYREALYASGFKTNDRGAVELTKPLVLCVHRIKKIEPTRRRFEPPAGEELSDEYFGFMKEAPFRAKIKFDPKVGAYIQERKWSSDQTIHLQKNGRLVLEFTAQSRPEVVSWALGFGPLAEVVGPPELKDEVRKQVRGMSEMYG